MRLWLGAQAIVLRVGLVGITVLCYGINRFLRLRKRLRKISPSSAFPSILFFNFCFSSTNPRANNGVRSQHLTFGLHRLILAGPKRSPFHPWTSFAPLA